MALVLMLLLYLMKTKEDMVMYSVNRLGNSLKFRKMTITKCFTVKNSCKDLFFLKVPFIAVF